MLKIDGIPEWHKFKTIFCEFPFKKIKVSNDGSVSQCCYQQHPIGNLLHQSIEEIWNSPLSKEIREATDNNILHKNCSVSGSCPFLGKPLEGYKFQYGKDPTSLEFDLPSKHCNIGGLNPSDKNPACIMCPRSNPEFTQTPNFTEDNTFILLEKLKFIFPNLLDFSILGVAEPFWRNKIFEIFDFIKFRGLKFQIFFWTFTNGTVFDEATALKFIEYTHRSLLYFSLDAATPETYKIIRRRDLYDIAKKNIKRYCKKLRDNRHEVKIVNNINSLNVHEMPKMIEEAKEMGVDEVEINLTHSCNGTMLKMLKDIMIKKDNKEIFKEYSEKAIEKSKELDIKLDLYRDFEATANINDALVQITT